MFPPFPTGRGRLSKSRKAATTSAPSASFPGRGDSSRSRKPENVLKQARSWWRPGYKEIVLTGIHTGGYGEDLEDYSLADLLWDLDKIEGLKRIRISSIEASQIDDADPGGAQHVGENVPSPAYSPAGGGR